MRLWLGEGGLCLLWDLGREEEEGVRDEERREMGDKRREGVIVLVCFCGCF